MVEEVLQNHFGESFLLEKLRRAADAISRAKRSKSNGEVVMLGTAKAKLRK